MGLGGAIIGALLSRILWPPAPPHLQESDVTFSDLVDQVSDRPLLPRGASKALLGLVLTGGLAAAGWAWSVNSVMARQTEQIDQLERAVIRLTSELSETNRVVRENTNATQRLIGKIEGRL